MRLCAFVLLTLTLFAGEEVIAACDGSAVTLTSGRILHFADDPKVQHVLRQMQEGDRVNLQGKGVVVVSYPTSALLLFADEGEQPCESVQEIELFSLPRSGSRMLLSLLRYNLPNTQVRWHRFDHEKFADTICAFSNLDQARDAWLKGISSERILGEHILAVIGVRAPRSHMESIYRISALAFKADIGRGFTLFLNGAARLPSLFNLNNPLTNTRCSNPMQARQLWLLQALFVERLVHNSLVVDFGDLCDKPAEIIARISATYGIAHAPYFKGAELDTSGKGPYRSPPILALTKAQENQMRLVWDSELERHFGFQL